MSSWLLSFAFFCAWQTALARPLGPIVVGGGAGESEYSVVFTQINLESLLSECRDLDCGLSVEEKNFFPGLLKRAKASPKALFKTNAELPNQLYILSADHSEVWINKDLLWLDAGKLTPYNVASAGVLWVQILADDLAIPDVALKSIQKKFSEALSQNITRQTEEYRAGTTFEILLWKRNLSSDRLFIRDPALQSLEIINFLPTDMNCNGTEQIKIFSPAWTSATETEAHISFHMQFGLKWTCGQNRGQGSGNLVVLAAKDQNGIYRFDADSVVIHLEKGIRK